MYPPIDEIIEAAASIGVKPLEIRLGRLQMEEFRRWALSLPGQTSNASPGAGAPDEYDGIPVVEVPQENRRAYLKSDDRLVILD